ncbi:MAG: helix-turn-helix transcriptional regulator [Elusimicrobiaceae bacterium]|nr:helix-turn-helix transcriptional regulator [Elusimicrobiaceae bacterium]
MKEMKFRNQLFVLRKCKCMLQRDVAAQMGMSQRMLSAYERCERPIPSDKLIAFAEFYGCSIERILDLDAPEPVNETYTLEWQPLPAPPDRYVLVRFKDLDNPELWCSELAFSIDGLRFLGDNDIPFYTDVVNWAYVPYDEE